MALPPAPRTTNNLLLTENMTLSLKATFNRGYSFCFVPFDWNGVEQKKARVEHGHRTKLFNFNVCINAFHATWLCYQAWEMKDQKLDNGQMEQLALFGYVALCVNSLFYQISLILFGEDLCLALDLTLKFLQAKSEEMRQLGIKKRPREIILADFLLGLVCPCLLLSYLCVPVLVIVSPSSSILTLSGFPYFHSGIGLCISMFVELYIALGIAAATGAYLWSGIVIAFGALASLTFYLDTLRWQEKSSYRFLRVLISVLGFYSAIRLGGPTGISSGVIAFMVLLTVLISFRAVAEFHRKSHSILYLLRRSMRKRHNTRQLELKAFQVIRVKVSCYFYIDTKFVLVILGFVIMNVGNLLIAA